MGLRGRLSKLLKEAEDGAVVVRLRDGGARYFEEMEVFKRLFLAQMDLFKGVVPDSEVLDAVRDATPESRRAFEVRFGPITMEARIIASDWVEAYSLTETGAVEKVRHEGEEAERICQKAKRGGAPGSRGGRVNPHPTNTTDTAAPSVDPPRYARDSGAAIAALRTTMGR